MQRYPTPNTDEVAGVLDRRAEALLIDAILVASVSGVIGYIAGTALVGGPLGGFGGLLVALQFGAPVALLIYQFAFEGYCGQTVGKQVRGIVVVRKDGSRCTWGAAGVRNLLRIIDALPVFYIVGIIFAYVSSDQKRIGDRAAKTVVVSTSK